MMQKLLAPILAVQLLMPVSAPVLVLATHSPQHIVCDQVGQIDESCAEAEDKIFGPGGLVTRIVQTLVFIVGAVSVLMIVIGAINYATSAGNPDRAKSAGQTILYAIIGIIIALLAQGIVFFVLRRLT